MVLLVTITIATHTVMVKTQHTKPVKDTGQTKLRNTKSTINNAKTNKESNKLDDNLQRNHQKSFTINNIKIDARKLTVEIEINNKDVSDDNIATGIALNIMDGLLDEWIEEDII